MPQFGIFVDGSNLSGTLSKVNLKVLDFERFYQHAFEEGVKSWSKSFFNRREPDGCRLHRVMWYQIGSIDRLEFSDAKLIASQRAAFDRSEEKSHFVKQAGQKLSGRPQDAIHDEAWNLFWAQRKTWYADQCSKLDKMKEFNHAVQQSCDFLEIVSCGHWKVDILRAYLSEKGVDTAFAVGVATDADQLDVILLLSGDADFIPCVQYAKKRQCSVGVLDIIKGSPPEQKGRQSSTRLHTECDFVVRIYETELIRHRIAEAKRGDHGV